MDGGAWWAAVPGVAKSQTRLSNFTFTFHFHALEKEMATHSSVLAWKIPGMGEPGGLPSLGSGVELPPIRLYSCAPWHSGPQMAPHSYRGQPITQLEDTGPPTAAATAEAETRPRVVAPTAKPA